MPDLNQSLQGSDLSHLRIVAELWGLSLDAPEARSALRQLVPALLNRSRVAEMLATLSSEVRAALDDLVANQGRLPWPLFTRRYGKLREMGPARRDRERPYQAPTSPAEVLYYRALVARAFFDTVDGPQEFAYIPEDWLSLLPPPENPGSSPLGRPASPLERAMPRLVDDRILDHACTLLAALRMGIGFDELGLEEWEAAPHYPLTLEALQALLATAGLVNDQGLVQTEPTRLFLEAPRGQALSQLTKAWMDSDAFNELHLLPGLVIEGDWHNDSRRTRQAILDFLSTVPADTWWSLSALVTAVRQSSPDFQRPAGDYDSWFIRDRHSGEFLRGFEHWEAVDGALIRYLICGPLHWLGILDLAVSGGDDRRVSAFRFSRWAADVLSGRIPQGLALEEATFLVNSDARLRIPRLAPRGARYQVARFSRWEKEAEDAYAYQLTPASLARARNQGLTIAHLLVLLRRYAATVPPSLNKALERWEARGSEARLEQVTILRLSSPELLQSLRSSRAARYLGDPLGPTSVVVKPGAWKKVLAALAEMGYLGEVLGEAE